MATSSPTVEADGSIPWGSSVLYVILAISLTGIMGVSLISPVLPELRGALNISDAQAGLVLTAYTLPGVLLTPFVGLVADRIGRRRVIIPLLFTFGIAGAAIGFAESFEQVLALRFVQGMGASALITLSVTLIGDLYEGQTQNAVMGFNGSTIGTGAAFYPLLGGLLGSIRWNVPFFFFGIAILVGVFATVILTEPDGLEPDPVAIYIGRLRDVLLLPQALAILAAILVVFAVFYGSVLTVLPLLLSDEFGLTSGEIGPVLAGVALASAIVSSQFGRISQWRRSQELVALGYVAFGSSLLGIWLAPSPVFIFISLLAFGVGFGITMPSIDTTIIGLVSSELRAGMMGIRTSVLRLGQTIGPFAFTYAAETYFETTVIGYRRLLLGSGLAVVSIGAIGYLVLRE
ncbi:MAG: MFS transporter [Natrialbaceae archaeon]|nr:MFS transporter [Natrialbaceae archaeon]